MTEETTRRGTEPPGYIGPDEHGPELPHREGAPRRVITSAVWGGGAVRVNSEHGQDVTPWNPTCSWYQYGLQLCLNGCQHPGMDIGVGRGTALFAAEGGTVEFAGWADYYRPHHVDIRTADGSLHIYGHMWSVDPAVVAGGQVSAGQLLGTSGEQTQRGTMIPDGSGPHLHFEVRSGGCAVDPEPILVGAEPPRPFAVKDKLRVADGPLRLRTNPGLNAGIIVELATGTELCVAGGPQEANGHTWYQVNLVDGTNQGWVAGRFCALVAAQAC
jgi:murein DD-endopeptidase MepM/ murein hydrolase activator NlpD